MSEPGDSSEQRNCEPFILSAVALAVECELQERRFVLAGGGYLKVDGCNREGSVLCEAWAHSRHVQQHAEHQAAGG